MKKIWTIKGRRKIENMFFGSRVRYSFLDRLIK